MRSNVNSRRRRLVRLLAITSITAAVASSPAPAVLDEGGAAQARAPQVTVEGIDWSDAAIGVGIGAAAGLVAAGAALAVRRRRVAPDELAGPAAR